MAVAAITRGGGAVLASVGVITEEDTRGGPALTLLTDSEVTEARAPAMTFLTEAGVCWAPRPL